MIPRTVYYLPLAKSHRARALIIINDSEIDSALSLSLSVYTSSSGFMKSVDKLYETVE